MPYLLLSGDGEIAAYPYSPSQLRMDNPGTSFPDILAEETLVDWGVYYVLPNSAPVVDYTQNVAETLPQQIDGLWTQAWAVTDASEDEIAERTAAQAAAMRADRNARLAACDWTQLADAPGDTLAWANYRQQLRDVTAQPGFPWAVSWPVPPA
jgi:hypothetical protein